MSASLFVAERTTHDWKVASDLVHLKTEKACQLIDLTDLVAERVRRSRVQDGLACVQSLHTTAGLLVNESEPLLLADIETRLQKFAPRGRGYAHDDWERRGGVPRGERPNGHAHCQALLLAPALTLTIVAGRLLLGRWQRLFLAELDGGRSRSLCIVVAGSAEPAGDWE